LQSLDITFYANCIELIELKEQFLMKTKTFYDPAEDKTFVVPPDTLPQKYKNYIQRWSNSEQKYYLERPIPDPSTF
jgi:predicted urease superfamily metal-dependent hydrolase